MRWTRALPRQLAFAAAGLLAASLVVAAGQTTGNSGGSRPPLAKTDVPPVPFFSRTEPAANKAALVLMPDEKGVHGWVAGGTDFAGKTVTVKAGKKDAEVKVGAGNVFFWEHRAKAAKDGKEPPAAAFTLDVPGGQPLTGRVVLVPAAADPAAPSVFFVTDRSAYRPGHTLHFVAYLRTLLPNGEFAPVADKDVTVDLTSAAKQTRATRLKLRSDSSGRVAGSYTFSEADALDHYNLAAEGFTGGTGVLLGEYRKAKVGLKITGEVKDGKLVVTFDAKDYLDRSVKGTSATFSATVMRAADPAKLTLNPASFVAPEPPPPSADDLAALPDDERLLALAHGVSAMTFAGFGGRVVATREGTVSFAADGPGKATLDLNPEWLKGHHSVFVNGVLLDETGRENRSTATIELDPKPGRGVKITTPRELVAAGEKVPVAVEPFGFDQKEPPATTLVVVRLDANPSAPWGFVQPFIDDDGEVVPDNTRLPALTPAKPKKAPAPEGWKTWPMFDPVKRSIVTVLPAAGGRAEVDLRQPGAYKLLAVTRLTDGTVFQAETGVVVKSAARLPGVVLALDSREVKATDRLHGVVHTRFAGAKMLLTLRDSTGVKLVKPLTAGPDGVAKIDEALPANLRYGVAVCVQYPETPALVHADQRELFVVPTDRTINVTTKLPEVVGPGAEVKLDIDVNREEEVDLVVSVYDESLLTVTADLNKDIRDFFLADARGHNRAARELAAARMGSVTVAELVAKAEKMLKQPDELTREPGLQQRLEKLSLNWKDGKLSLADVATLVRLAGHEVYLAYPFVNNDGFAFPVAKAARLADLFRRGEREVPDQPRAFISAAAVGNVILLAFAGQNNPDPWAMHRSGQVYNWGFGQLGFQGFGFCGGFNCSGFGQFGNLGGQFGLAGQWGFQPRFGAFGFGGGAFGLGGFGGGGLAGGNAAFSNGFGFQGSFSHLAPGGQMGMSFGFNRDFGPAAPGATLQPLGPAPGLNLGNDVVRRDFADSAFWSAGLRTDKAGKATATFKVPDSLTNWRVVVTAVSPKMHVGTAASRFRTSRPVMIWPMLPRAFAEGDTVAIFGLAQNLTDKPREITVHCKAENGQVLTDATKTVTVPPNGSVPVYWTYRAGAAGMTDILMSAKCDAGSDASLKRLPVTRAGIEERATSSGLVGKGDLKFTLPADFDPAKASVSVTVAPTLAADLADTLPYLVEYPYGCVEQTMSRFLPAIRVSQILQQTGGSTLPQLEKKLPKVVEAGVKRLLELQQPDGGWAWHGNGQTHEMMTPYALFGLLEAEKAGYPIPNEQAIQRGLTRLKQFLEHMKPTWQAIDAKANLNGRDAREINDSLYLLYVLSNREPVTAEWWSLIEKGVGSPRMSDYGHALALEMAVKAGKKELAGKLAAELRKRAKKSGELVYWTTAGFSRWGDNTFEVTAACFKALVAFDVNDPLVPGVLAFFHSTKRGDRWDSTKDTAVILYALCDYLAAARAAGPAAGTVAVAVNGGAKAEVALDGPRSKSVALPAKDLKPGENAVSVAAVKGDTSQALVRLVVKFHRGGADIPARDHGVKVTRVVSVKGKDGKWADLKPGASIPKGSFVRVRVTADATDKLPLTFTLVESPKPSCGENVPADDRRFVGDLTLGGYVLREDREAMTCFHFENGGTSLIADYVFLAEFAGEFRLPPARVELMYSPTRGGHSDSFKLTVTEK